MNQNSQTHTNFRKDIQVTCSDGVRLHGLLHLPDGEAKALILINPGTATRTSYYHSFAEFLRLHGMIVCTWNYRGVSESKYGSLKNCHFSMRDIKSVQERNCKTGAAPVI